MPAGSVIHTAGACHGDTNTRDVVPHGTVSLPFA